MKKKIISVFVLLVLVCSINCITYEAAEINSYTYQYDYWGNAVISPDAYCVSKVISGDLLKIGTFAGPEDLFIDHIGNIFVVDTNNNRIVVLDSNGKLKRIYTTFFENGEKSCLNRPMGIFVNDAGEMLIADRENHRVIRSDSNGKIIGKYERPSEENKNNLIAFSGIDYLPCKVIEDNNGFVYVLCYDVYEGALMYSSKGDFVGYFGGNRTEVTLNVIMNRFWRKFMTKEQRSKTSVYYPFQFDNFYLDDSQFIYTCTELSETKKEQIKKLNAKGINVLTPSSFICATYQGMYGDLKIRNANGKTQQTFLTDITVDEDGFMTVVDYDRGHIFQYDKNSNLLMVFGGKGNQAGYFEMISSVENYNGKIYVLDRMKNNITVFEETSYGKKLHQAVKKFNNSQYLEAVDDWEKIKQENRNSSIADIAIGRAYYEKSDWENAMRYFKQGDDRADYSKAYKEYRSIIVEKYFFPVLFGIVAFLIILSFLLKSVRKRKGKKQ